MLITKEVMIGFSSKNIKWYEDKGYKIERYYNEHNRKMLVKKGTKITVKVEDLQDRASAKVDIECDSCGKQLIGIRWYDYKTQVKEDNKYYCQRCANAGFKHWDSFYDWCYDHLTKEEADIVMLRWDYNLNIDRRGSKVSPKDISYASHGLNRKGYWFKCLDHPEHGSEEKATYAFTRGQKGSLDCDRCNTIFVTHPHLINFFVNKEDAHKYSFGAGEMALVKCPDCGYEKMIKISNLINHGLGCNKCSDGVSYPEKFITSVLEQLHQVFEIQLSKRTFEWCLKYRYDLYINHINGIIEIQGIQHYQETKSKWGSLKDIQDNDRNKLTVANKNGISHYIIVDCRYSDMEFIRENIMNSELPTLLNFKEEDIDWLKCHEAGCSSLVKISCDMWSSGIRDISKIGVELKLDKCTIRNYLKKGAKLSWCNYNTKEEICIKVICTTTGEIFDSLYKASEGGRESIRPNISQCCKGNHKSAGKHPITNEPLVWMYYDDYVIKPEEEKTILINSKYERKYLTKSVICLTTNEIFNSALDASNKHNINKSGIVQCCLHVQKSSGKGLDGTKLVWMYYKEYLEKNK
ncbi:MAG TPA: hypothetical protein VIM70_04250 [Clostridium sp.]|uniref:hypothetical protein n=1 Tax=Clostridium sp. TaxID=1506 RepID=UPI002F922412